MKGNVRETHVSLGQFFLQLSKMLVSDANYEEKKMECVLESNL